jgi:hypothetical protein
LPGGDPKTEVGNAGMPPPPYRRYSPAPPPTARLSALAFQPGFAPAFAIGGFWIIMRNEPPIGPLGGDAMEAALAGRRGAPPGMAAKRVIAPVAVQTQERRLGR